MSGKNVRKSGFTLIELVVVLGIFGLLTALLSVAFPAVREKQRLTLAQQELQSLVREAQRRALNEERDDACLQRAADPVLCSDIGLNFTNNTVTMFADIGSLNTFASTNDYIIQTTTLPGSVRVTAPHTLIFRAVPPNITLIANGAEVSTTSFVLTSGKSNTTIEVSRYGIIERR